MTLNLIWHPSSLIGIDHVFGQIIYSSLHEYALESGEIPFILRGGLNEYLRYELDV